MIRVEHIDDPEFRVAWSGLVERSALTVERIFRAPAWNTVWWEHFGASDPARAVMIIGVYDGKTLIGVAPLFVQSRRLVRRILWQYALPLGGDLSPYPGIVAAAGREAEVMSQLTSALSARFPELWLHLPYVCSKSDEIWSPILLSLGVKDGQTSRYYTLDLSRGAMVEEMVHPSFLRTVRRARKLVREHDTIEWHCVREMSEAEIASFITLCNLRFGRASFLSRATEQLFFRSLIAAHPGKVLLSTVSISGAPVHSLFCLTNGSTCSYLLSGFDDTAAKVRPGIINFIQLIEHLQAEGYHTLDFLRGEERYKADFGARMIERGDATWIPASATRAYRRARRWQRVRMHAARAWSRMR